MGPAAAIIEKCGGHAAVAGWLGLDISRVYRWTYPKERGGTGGLIPAQYHQPILRHAIAAGKGLTPDDFFPEYAAAAERRRA